MIFIVVRFRVIALSPNLKPIKSGSLTVYILVSKSHVYVIIHQLKQFHLTGLSFEM